MALIRSFNFSEDSFITSFILKKKCLQSRGLAPGFPRRSRYLSSINSAGKSCSLITRAAMRFGRVNYLALAFMVIPASDTKKSPTPILYLKSRCSGSQWLHYTTPC